MLDKHKIYTTKKYYRKLKRKKDWKDQICGSSRKLNFVEVIVNDKELERDTNKGA
jgi:hypothetical protein